MNSSIKPMTIVAFCSALLAISAQITIPIPLVPITGQTLAIGLVATILSPRQSVQVVLLYLAIGVIGLPVFANFSGGMGILFGPTGGYLFSFLASAFLISLYLNKTSFTKVHAITANLLGMFVNLSIGTIWLKYYLQVDFSVAIVSGFLPFLVVGIIKATVAGIFGIILRERLTSAKILPNVPF